MTEAVESRDMSILHPERVNQPISVAPKQCKIHNETGAQTSGAMVRAGVHLQGCTDDEQMWATKLHEDSTA